VSRRRRRFTEGESDPKSGEAGSSGENRFDGLSRRAQVILTLVGTLVAIVTGMVALAGKVGSGHQAQAEASLPEYRQSVGEVCAAVNDHEDDRAENTAKVARRVARARTTLAQRDAVQDATQLVVRNGEHDLAMLQGLDAPRALTRTADTAAAAWTRTLDRLRDYVHRLDVATSPATVFAAAEHWSDAQLARHRDLTTQRAALVKLGGGRCRLDAEIATKAIRFTWIDPGAQGTRRSVTAHSKAPKGGGAGGSSPDGGTQTPAAAPPAGGSASASTGTAAPPSSPDGSPDATPAAPASRSGGAKSPDASGGGAGEGGGG